MVSNSTLTIESLSAVHSVMFYQFGDANYVVFYHFLSFKNYASIKHIEHLSSMLYLATILRT